MRKQRYELHSCSNTFESPTKPVEMKKKNTYRKFIKDMNNNKTILKSWLTTRNFSCDLTTANDDDDDDEINFDGKTTTLSVDYDHQNVNV